MMGKGEKKCGDFLLNPTGAVIILTFINFVNYVDRGIIPCASTSLRGCLYEKEGLKTCPTLVKNATLPKNWCVECPMCASHCSTVELCGIQCDEQSHTIKQLGFGISETQLGFLQSSFMIGYSLAALFFGHAVHHYKPFRLMSVGLTLWVVAAFLSGYSGIMCKEQQAENDFNVSKVCSSFYLMVFARILSGVGEASFATISVPYLDDVVSKDRIGLSLAIYFSAIPVGTAIGFIWGGQMSEKLSWEYAFLIESPLMIPICIYFWFVPHTLSSTNREKNKTTTNNNNNNNNSEALLRSDTYEERIANRDENNGSGSGSQGSGNSYNSSSDESIDMMIQEDNDNYESNTNNEKNNLLSEVKALICNPVYIFTCIGYSAFTAVTAGFAFYAPTFVQRNNPCLNVQGPCTNEWHFSQSTADLAFGAVVASSGLLGTAIGGKILDYCISRKKKQQPQLIITNEVDDNEGTIDYSDSKNNNNDDDDMVTEQDGLKRSQYALVQLTWEALLGAVVCVFAVQSSNPTLFFCGIWLGCLVIFTTTSAVNGVLLWSVPVENRAMSMGLSVLILHAFGDVPSPIVIGLIDDTWKDPKFTMSLTASWLLVCVIAWFLAYSTIKWNWWDVNKTRRSSYSVSSNDPLLSTTTTNMKKKEKKKHREGEIENVKLEDVNYDSLN